MNLKYDHAFTSDRRHQFHRQLQKLGFLQLPNEVEHPNKHFCRFIGFRENERELPVYLEFVDARDPKKPIRHPGLSLRALGPLEKSFKQLKRKGIQATFEHKNYAWKEDAKSRLPGWNFVTFKKLGFHTLFPWITEYEPHPSRQRSRIPMQKHPNGVRRLLAIEIEINPQGKKFFEKLLGRKLTRPIQLPGGQTFYFTHAKRTKIRSIVLETDSMNAARQFIKVKESSWRGRAALEIKNPSQHWDLLVV